MLRFYVVFDREVVVEFLIRLFILNSVFVLVLEELELCVKVWDLNTFVIVSTDRCHVILARKHRSGLSKSPRVRWLVEIGFFSHQRCLQGLHASRWSTSDLEDCRCFLSFLYLQRVNRYLIRISNAGFQPQIIVHNFWGLPRRLLKLNFFGFENAGLLGWGGTTFATHTLSHAVEHIMSRCIIYIK